MKHILKSLIITLSALYIALHFIPTVEFGDDPKNILAFIGGIWIISQIINPIFSIVLLPVNLLTFGMFSFILNAAFIFALTNFAPGFYVGEYDFPGANIEGVILPSYYFSEILTIIVVAIIITTVQKILHLIFE